MEEFLSNLHQNPELFYFLIIFAILWIGGIFWGIIVVIRHLSKKRNTIKILRSFQYEPIGNNPKELDKIKDISLQTVCKRFGERVESNPQSQRLVALIKNKKIRINYKIPKTEYRKLARTMGVREQIQIIGRKFTINKILYKSNSFYAHTIDAEIIRAYKPRRQIRSITGWILCFSSPTNFPCEIIVNRKFTGYKKMFISMAYKITNVHPTQIQGLMANFSREFDVNIGKMLQKNISLSEEIQNLLLRFKDFIPQEVKLFFSPNGVWISSEISIDATQMKNIVKLCELLLKF